MVRYHHLFAGYLRKRLERDHADRIVTLHRTASAWFADHGLLSEAVTHALAAGNDTGAVDLVERQAMHMVEHSRMATLLGLVNKLPTELPLGRPKLQIAIAWANCLLQRARPAQTALDHVRAAIGSATDEESVDLLGEADVLQACIDIYGDRIDRAAALVDRYLVPDPPYRSWLVAVSANIRAFVDIHTFRYGTAQERQRWANPFHATTTGPFAGVYGRCFAGLAALAQLNLVGAQRLYEEAVALARGSAGQHSHAARLAGALLGRLHYERGDADTAERLLEGCHELGAESGVAEFLIATFTTLARIKALRGDPEKAWSLLDEGHEAATQLALPRLAAAVDDERVRMHLALGDVGRAESVLARQGEVPRGYDGITMAVRHHHLGMRAQLLSAKGDHDGARSLLTDVLDESRAVGWRYAKTIARIDLAGVHAVVGDTATAVRTLVPALVVSAQAGLIRSVVDRSPALLKIIADLRDAARCRRWPADLPEVPFDYLSRLLATARSTVQPGTPAVIVGCADHPGAEEPLNAREIEILRLVDLGLSNKEIARKLGVTINTVKWYLKNICTKLGVARRTESVREARRRHILT